MSEFQDLGRGMTQYGHAGQHHGIGTPECPRELHHHHDERCDPLADRRQRAREAFQDASGLGDNGWHANDLAIETATRVRVDDEIMHAYRMAVLHDGANAGVIAAFRAAGFEVED